MSSTPPVINFARSLYPKFPELTRPVRWSDFLAMAERSRVSVRVVRLSRPARLIRYGQALCIRINRQLNYHLRTLYGMHELCHVWRDEIGASCIYADEATVVAHPTEDFADLFAWFVTSEARVFHEPLYYQRRRGRSWAEKIAELERSGVSVGAISVLASQPEERVLSWKRGRGKPDPATARILDRTLSAVERSASIHRRENETGKGQNDQGRGCADQS
jgi:hypothetical protein